MEKLLKLLVLFMEAPKEAQIKVLEIVKDLQEEMKGA